MERYSVYKIITDDNYLVYDDERREAVLKYVEASLRDELVEKITDILLEGDEKAIKVGCMVSGRSETIPYATEFRRNARVCDIVRCAHCKHCDGEPSDWPICNRTGLFISPLDFCSYGERRE